MSTDPAATMAATMGTLATASQAAVAAAVVLILIQVITLSVPFTIDLPEA